MLVIRVRAQLRGRVLDAQRVCHMNEYTLFIKHSCVILAVCPSGCFNGGWCSSPGVCTCSGWWTGSNCNTREYYSARSFQTILYLGTK